ncbi:uncharacterized protein LOC127791642 [Diospyros lotus]|uniref:uncharacterized protein LOC127791642 n=1 Tax=Diospyros lotus TaxID=55363 RepID=UPI00224E487D|nr:uncharacterized protein LOC127791642 [Diospyros lotus]
MEDQENDYDEANNEQVNTESMFLFRQTTRAILNYYAKYMLNEPCRTSQRTGHTLMHEILNGNETRCYQDFRMTKSIFLDLCRDLTETYGLTPTRGMSVPESVGIFLMICGYGVGNRLIQEMFNHSGETISQQFHRVLVAVNKLAIDIIKPHPNYNDGEGYHKPNNPKYLPFFKDCIGAIDGTHVKARLPRGEEVPYIGHKGYATQNILAIVDFNMCFTFAWAGWEGSAHDARIFGEAIHRSDLNFPYPTGEKYYLVDAGYSHTTGYMGPYKGENIRYHLEDFRRARTSRLRAPRGHKESFNYLHSSCRMVVERTFGVWKKRFRVWEDMPAYNFDTQRDIVLGTMAIHNYIRKKWVHDVAFTAAENENYIPDAQSVTPSDS